MNIQALIVTLFLCIYFHPQSNNYEPLPLVDDFDIENEWPARDSVIGQNIDRYLTAMEAQGFSGAIIVSKGDKVVLRKGYGLADRRTRRPYTPKTVQSHGSITKQMTAAAILLLESRGELSIDDSLGQYFDDIPKDKREITIHELLTHSSGLPGGIGYDEEPIRSKDYVDRLMADSLQFEPGAGYGYSNAGYALLGILTEKVTGRDYETFLREELLLPAGLTETGYVLPAWEKERLALGYRHGKEWGLVYERGWLKEGPGWHLRANGGLHTTVDDMYTWLKTVQGRGVLDEDVARRWTTGYVSENNGYSDYGYGWVVYEHDQWGKVITHSGSNRIFEADFVWLPDLDLFFYIHGNTSMVLAASLSGYILSAAFDTGFVMPPIVEMDDAADPETALKREGMYHLDGGHLELTADDTRLVAKLTGQPVLDLIFGYSNEQKKWFSELNTRTRIAMDKLQDSQEDALSGMLHDEEDPLAFTAPFLRRIQQIGNLDSLHVIGTFANTPGSPFYKDGPWTTFVYAEFENWNQYWNLIWDEDGTYKVNRSGPWPTITLIPTGEKQYTGVLQRQPWNTVAIEFKNECLMLGKQLACPGG